MNADNLIPAIKTGTVTEETINLKVQHILQTLIAYGMLDKEQKDSNIPLDNPFSRQTALELAREGVVLLKNEANLLPLKGKTAVMGPNADLYLPVRQWFCHSFFYHFSGSRLERTEEKKIWYY